MENDPNRIMTREQLRAARALLGWSQEDLAAVSGVSAPTIKRLEPGAGPMATREDTLEKLRIALEGAGITFPEPTEGGRMGVFYTPRAVIDVMVDLGEPVPSDVPTRDPAAGTGNILSRMFGTNPSDGSVKMRRLPGFGSGENFAIPKARLDRIKAGESALKHLREVRGLSTHQFADALARDIASLSEKDNSHKLTEEEVRAAEYISLTGLPVLQKIGYVLGVSPAEIGSYDRRLKPKPPPDDLINAIERLRHRRDYAIFERRRADAHAAAEQAAELKRHLATAPRYGRGGFMG